MNPLDLSQALDAAVNQFYPLMFKANDEAVKAKLRRAQDHLRAQLAEQNAVILTARRHERTSDPNSPGDKH